MCDALLPDYTYSLGWDQQAGPQPQLLPIVPLRSKVKPYIGMPLSFPPGWGHLWSSVPRISVNNTLNKDRVDSPSDADR